MYITFEIFLANFSFLSLLVSMLIYWFQTSNLNFSSAPLKKTLDNTKGFNFLKKIPLSIPIKPGEVLYSPSMLHSSPKGECATAQGVRISPLGEECHQKSIFSSNILGFSGMLISNFSLFFLLTLRWFESGHFPLSNLY